MGPNDAYRELADHAQQIETKSQGELGQSINQSYFLLRRWIAGIALAMPVALWLAGVVIHDRARPNASLSSYYYDPGDWARDLFVGSLCVIGFFLYFYKGYTKTEDRLLNVAGISAALVALSPMTCFLGSQCDGQHRLFPEVLFTLGQSAVTLHGLAAVTLFLMIAFVCIFESRQTLKLIHDQAVKARYNWQYRALGTLMVALPLTVVAINFLSGRKLGEGIAVFLIEVTGIAVFAIFWLVKSREIDLILKQRS
jgi:hypothetical protein